MTIYNGDTFEPKKLDEDAELLLDLLYGAIESEGYNVKGYGEVRLITTADGGIIAERDGGTFHITVDKKGSE